MNAYDIKNAVYDRLYNHMIAIHSDLNMSGAYSMKVSKLPTLTLEEIDNSVYQRISVGNIQNGVLLEYEITVYTNSVGRREEEAREIMADADQAMLGMGFTRTMSTPVPNFADSTIYAMKSRYEGVAVTEGTDSNPAYRIYQAHVSQAKMR